MDMRAESGLKWKGKGRERREKEKFEGGLQNAGCKWGGMYSDYTRKKRRRSRY